MNRLNILKGAGLALTLASVASAQSLNGNGGTVHNINPAKGGIDVNTTLTLAESPWEIVDDVYIVDGATLNIEAGVELRSNNGTLVITRGCIINAAGTVDAPIRFTSTLDNGTYRPNVCQEWGNLTVMGAGYVNTCRVPTNTAAPNANNFGVMEGLVTQPTFGDSLREYGGNDDNDNSGTISYCSFSYGGRAVNVGSELNGLSLGAIGRNTDIHHVEVFANVDDGIEIWGGTVNLKHINIWNVGDDSFDIDQGWRGKAQFGLIVQGHSCSGASQGSGMGDNAIEMDGAEQCTWQPVSSVRIANFTVIGGGTMTGPQTDTGTDDLVELRDNVRVQFRNCIFMDSDAKVYDDAQSDNEACNNGAGCGGLVPTDLARAQTAATTTWNQNVFAAPEISPATAYQSLDPAGNLIQFRGCRFYNNNNPTAYGEATGLGIFTSPAGTNHADNTIMPSSSPIMSITRGAVISPNGVNNYAPVTNLDPRPTNGAETATECESDGGAFLDEALYCGAFAPGQNWLNGWSLVAQYGLCGEAAMTNTVLAGQNTVNSNGCFSTHATSGTWTPGNPVSFTADNLFFPVSLLAWNIAPANPLDPFTGANIGFLGLGFDLLVPSATGVITSTMGTTGPNSTSFGFNLPPLWPAGTPLYSQVITLESSSFGSTNACYSVSN